jgi:hypothetical protein
MENKTDIQSTVSAGACEEAVKMLRSGLSYEDLLCLQDHNMNLLAWFGFEEAARIVAEREEIGS